MPVQKETRLQNEIRLRVSEACPDVTLWRNSVGTFKTSDGKWVQAGLGAGSADLIGICRGRFVALEVKLPGQKPRPDQVNFLEHVKKMGGIAGVVTSPQEAIDLLSQCV
jgi:hypothetical protein